MRKNFTIFMITLLVALLSGTVSAQRLAVKSNLLYDITSTINLGVEYEVAPRWTLEMSVNYNPWSFSDNKKMKLWMLQPEARYWLCSGFSGHFFGAHLLGGEFNYGGMLPFGITPSLSGLGSKRYQGWDGGSRNRLRIQLGAGQALEFGSYPRTGLCTFQLRPFRVQDVRRQAGQWE